MECVFWHSYELMSCQCETVSTLARMRTLARATTMSPFSTLNRKSFEKVDFFKKKKTIGFCKRPLGSNGSVMFYQNSTGFHKVRSGYKSFHKIPQSSSRFQWCSKDVPLGFANVPQGPMGFHEVPHATLNTHPRLWSLNMVQLSSEVQLIKADCTAEMHSAKKTKIVLHCDIIRK